MRIRPIILSSFILIVSLVQGQKLSGVVKIEDLLGRIKQADTTYVINFWALWCKPCIQELPAFDSLNTQSTNSNIKVLLVNLDFIESKEKVNEFLQRKNIKAQCVLLDEVDGNSYIDRISTSWSGAIPGTFVKQRDKTAFIEHKLNLSQLNKEVQKISGN